MYKTQKAIDELTYQIIGCAIEVHKAIGPGLLESVYELCLAEEMHQRSISFERQMSVPLIYKGLNLHTEFRLDFLVENTMVVELKVTEGFHPVHKAQILTYMALLQKPKGLLLNFNCTNIFGEGQKTMVNKYFEELPLS